MAAAKRAGVRFIAYTSRVVKAQDASDNPLMAGQFATEESGLTNILFRNALYKDTIPLFVGGDKVFEAGIALPTGGGRVSFALRRELGEAIANMLAQDAPESRVIDLTAGAAWSFADVAATLTELSGRTVAYTSIDESAFLDRLRGRALPEPMARRSADFMAEIRNNRLDEVGPEMVRLLGRKPASLRDGLKVLFKLLPGQGLADAMTAAPDRSPLLWSNRP